MLGPGPGPASAALSVGLYCGDVGEYCGLVGLYCGLVGLYCGLVGLHSAQCTHAGVRRAGARASGPQGLLGRRLGHSRC